MIYVIDSPEHPLDVATAAEGLRSRVVSVPVADWGDALTPWPAPALRPGEKDFGGRADETLASLAAALDQTPGPLAVGGYSLGGLFALYAFVREPRLAACACLSGSVWYEGWVDWLRANAPDCSGRYAYFSVGKKEKRAGLPFRHVEEDLAACAEILRAHGCRVDVALGPGSHMQHVIERLAAGLTALDAFLA
ncbi:alpha/beta hydrolase [Thermophilibacter sp.]|uniref:alpha/beta hydrolase n=1 Tax=Thermophilibacter sp. TaxID=2847309 RepID=UPI003A8F02B7